MKPDADWTPEDWKALKAHGKARRSANREHGAAALAEHRIPFTIHNEGAHLIVDGRFDYWPGTGKWSRRGVGADSGVGLRGLLKRLGVQQP